MVQHCEALGRAVQVVNLDPAAELFSYPVMAGERQRRSRLGSGQPRARLGSGSAGHGWASSQPLPVRLDRFCSSKTEPVQQWRKMWENRFNKIAREP